MKAPPEIYLTFDDGIHAGTEEVLETLKEDKVKATFFLIGIETSNYYRKNTDLVKKLLKDIFENHCVGNHTYSHAHFLFRSYYENNGIILNCYDKHLSIIQDFHKCVEVIAQLYSPTTPQKKCDRFLLSNFQTQPIARLPGRNTWHITITNYEGEKFNLIKCYEQNTLSVAKDLNDNGYNVFGWDLEWRMNFDFQKQAMDIISNLKEEGKYDVKNHDSVHPEFDMYSPENNTKDRLCQTWQECISEIKVLGKNKTILLMHDRAFRKRIISETSRNLNYNLNNPANDLKFLINSLTELNFVFKTLDEY